MTYNLLRVASIIVLLLTPLDWPYIYYIFLRFLVCGVSGYGAFLSNQNNNKIWLWTLGIIAILFNPIIPIHMEQESWFVIDVVTSILLAISFLFVKDK